MDDKEVGNWWKWSREVLEEKRLGLRPTQPVTSFAEALLEIIHKLVKERAFYWQAQDGIGPYGPNENYLIKALSDYGITLETWRTLE